jgi:hypothetical protein
VQGHSESNPELLDAAALCRQLVPDGSVEAFLADHRHELFPDEMFENLFPSGRGRPSIPGDVVASVWFFKLSREPTITDGCDSVASRGTNSVSRYGSRQSTSGV